MLKRSRKIPSNEYKDGFSYCDRRRVIRDAEQSRNSRRICLFRPDPLADRTHMQSRFAILRASGDPYSHCEAPRIADIKFDRAGINSPAGTSQ